MSEQVYEFLHRVALNDGTFANTVGPSDKIDAMYPELFTDDAEIYLGRLQTDVNGVTSRGINSVLRGKRLPSGDTAMQGWTVPRACPVNDCGNCALKLSGLSLSEMADINCARANSAIAFEMAELAPEERFMLTAVGRDAYVVADEHVTPEYNGEELMQYRLAAGPCVVMKESWLRERGLDRFAAGMSVADGSGVQANFEVKGERYFMFLLSMRQHMGDAEPENWLVHKGVSAVFDSLELTPEERTTEAENLHIAFTLSSSAALENFGHKIHIPKEDEDAPDEEQRDASFIREKYADLVELANGKITNAIVLNWQYPNAMRRGNVWPELEARMGIRKNPITPENCPGDGMMCHVDYRAETEYSFRMQLDALGVPEGNITFDDSLALDPASVDNKMASNRAEQNNGVEKAETGRTLTATEVWLVTPEELRRRIAAQIDDLSGRQWTVETMSLSDEERKRIEQESEAAGKELQRLHQIHQELTGGEG